MGNQSSFAIESAIEQFENFGMFANLSDKERMRVMDTLKHIAICGFQDAKTLLINAQLKIKTK